jgi:hypothetical protein
MAWGGLSAQRLNSLNSHDDPPETHPLTSTSQNGADLAGLKACSFKGYLSERINIE